MSMDTISASMRDQSCERSQRAMASVSPGAVKRPSTSTGGATTSAQAIGASICGYCRHTGRSSRGTSATRRRVGICGAADG